VSNEADGVMISCLQVVPVVLYLRTGVNLCTQSDLDLSSSAVVEAHLKRGYSSYTLVKNKIISMCNHYGIVGKLSRACLHKR
jgi:hypothetical protein